MLILEKEEKRLKEGDVFLKHHKKLISCNFILDWHSEYVVNPSEIKTAKTADPLKSYTKHFEFELQSKIQTGRGVCFSPQKRRLLAVVNGKNNFGVEIHQAKENNSNELMLNKVTQLNKTPLNYKKEQHNTAIKHRNFT